MNSFPDLEPVCCSVSSSNCCFLTCIQISQEAGQVAWYCHLLKNFPQFIVIHTVKGFGVALLDSMGEGKGGMIWENNTETCILPYVNYIPSPSLMHETGHSKLVHLDNPEGWEGEGDGRRVRDCGTHVHPWLIHVNVLQKPPQYYKIIASN